MIMVLQQHKYFSGGIWPVSPRMLCSSNLIKTEILLHISEDIQAIE